MAQEFRFGDAVHDMHDSGIVFWSNAEESGVLWSDTESIRVVPTNSLTLISHPDTVRLEKIGRLTVEAMGMAFDLDEYRRQIDQIGEQA
ncbi:MAG: hypothetical protein Q4A62_00405 [Eikenella sp.]|nr:hypothetical protein [Eikenella sp.]